MQRVPLHCRFLGREWGGAAMGLGLWEGHQNRCVHSGHLLQVVRPAKKMGRIFQFFLLIRKFYNYNLIFTSSSFIHFICSNPYPFPSLKNSMDPHDLFNNLDPRQEMNDFNSNRSWVQNTQPEWETNTLSIYLSQESKEWSV